MNVLLLDADSGKCAVGEGQLVPAQLSINPSLHNHGQLFGRNWGEFTLVLDNPNIAQVVFSKGIDHLEFRGDGHVAIAVASSLAGMTLDSI